MQGLRKLADDNGLLLIFDEVQTGCGRTGQWFAYQHFGVTPDVMTLAKAVCGGIAGGALLTTAEIAPSLRPGMHAATFGGNPIAARAGLAAIEMIEQENLLEHARQVSEMFRERLDELRARMRARARRADCGGDDRRRAVDRRGADRQSCLDRRLLVNCTHGTVIRLLPAMNFRGSRPHDGCDILAETIKQLARAT